MKAPLLAVTILLLPIAASHAFGEEKAPAPGAPEAPAQPAEPPKNPEAVDISGLEEDYWRPNKDELEVVQNRRFEKAKKWEAALQYGVFQGQDFVDAKSYGLTATYNFTNQFFAEGSFHSISNTDNEFLASIRTRFGITPDFNRQKHQYLIAGGWAPIYGKFALMGKKICHYEMFVAPGIGITKTAGDQTNTSGNNLTGFFTIGQKFFLSEHLLLRFDWRISKFTDTVTTTQGATSKANGGPGFVEQSVTTHNIIFGLGVMY